MFLKRLSFVAVMLLGINLFPQNISDTIHVVTLQSFNVPQVGAIVAANLLSFDFTAELLTAGGQKVRDIKGFTQRPRKEDFSKYVSGGRGTTVWLVLHDFIDQPGSYMVKITVSGKGETGAFKADRYYAVIVSEPTLAAPITLRPNYYFSENDVMSFATSEYTDFNLYSYQVLDGSAIIDSGRGSVVRLDKILSDINSVGKSITIKGFYQGNQFTFRNPFKDAVENSEWTFSIDKPAVQKFNGWSSAEPKAGEDPWYISVDNQFSKSFLFTYMGMKPGGIVAVTPEVRNLRVTAEPEAFITGATQRKQGVFVYIDLNVNPEFMNAMSTGSDADIKITVQFRTQFGDQVKETFYATVIK